MSGVSWTLDGVELAGSADDVQPGGYWFKTLADGWDLGEPEAVKVVFESLAADGEDERLSRHGNRTVAFQVTICGSDTLATGAGERALRLAMNKRTTLVFRPPDGLGRPVVFDVLTATMKYDADDFALTRAEVQVTFAVTLTCKPFTRPLDPVTVSMTYGTDTGSSLDSGGSTTGWSSSDGTLSAVTVNGETAVKVTLPTPATGTRLVRATRSGLALTAAKPYLAVTAAVAPNGGTAGQPSSVSVSLGGVSLGGAVAAVPLSSGFVRYFFAHTKAGTTQNVAVLVGGAYQDGALIGEVAAYSNIPGTGLLVADVEGSERAPVSVRVSRISAGSVGATFLYSDPSMLEYGWNPGDPATWPNAPRGNYLVVIPSGGADTNYSTLTVNGQVSSTRGLGSLGTARVYNYALGARRDGRLGTITTAWADQVNGAGSAETNPTTKYLFRDEPGETSLLYVSAVGYRNLFVDSPTIENPAGVQVWGGANTDGSDAVSLVTAVEIPGELTIRPPRWSLWVKAAVSDLAVSATYYPASHTMVPPLGLTS